MRVCRFVRAAAGSLSLARSAECSGARPPFEASTCPCGFANIKDLRLIRCSLGGLCPSVSPWFLLHGALSGSIPLYPAAFGLSGKVTQVHVFAAIHFLRALVTYPYIRGVSRILGFPFFHGLSISMIIALSNSAPSVRVADNCAVRKKTQGSRPSAFCAATGFPGSKDCTTSPHFSRQHSFPSVERTCARFGHFRGSSKRRVFAA